MQLLLLGQKFLDDAELYYDDEVNHMRFATLCGRLDSKMTLGKCQVS